MQKESEMKMVNGVWVWQRDFAAVVFVKGPKGTTLFVEDPKKVPTFPKLPGGKNEGDETPEACAVRELHEETGLWVKERDLVRVAMVDKGSHDFYLFTATAKSLGGLREKGDEGEIITVGYVDRIAEMNFFPPHKALLIKHGLIDVM